MEHGQTSGTPELHGTPSMALWMEHGCPLLATSASRPAPRANMPFRGLLEMQQMKRFKICRPPPPPCSACSQIPNVCRRTKNLLELREHFAKGEVTDKKVLRVTQRMGTLLRNVVLFEGDQLSEQQVDVISSNVQATSRCLTGIPCVNSGPNSRLSSRARKK